MHCLPSLFFTITIYQIDLWNIPDYSDIKSCCKLKPKSTFCFLIFFLNSRYVKEGHNFNEIHQFWKQTQFFTLTGKGEVSSFTVCSQIEQRAAYTPTSSTDNSNNNVSTPQQLQYVTSLPDHFFNEKILIKSET